ncbi:MAG: NAD(P)-dependent oxidoreductase [Anaerolineae bacterium]|nr:NAD(P)-dependent oxidoreductase [Anaerolineae bacterium]
MSIDSASRPSLRRRVLVTGASGEMAAILLPALRERYELLLADRRPLTEPVSPPFFCADITDYPAIRPLFDGVDTVVHLAAHLTEEWEALYADNIAGTYNVLRAAAEAACRRVIFASSSHVILGGWSGAPLDSDAPVRPLSLYGASKACGEALAAYFAFQRGLSVICLRLGWVTPYDHPRMTPGSRALDLLITPGDLVRLMIAAIEAPEDLRFTILPGLSNNAHKRMAIDDTRRILGYAPQDDPYALAWRNFRGMWLRLRGAIRRRLLFKSTIRQGSS